jgi:hypothetical protein
MLATLKDEKRENELYEIPWNDRLWEGLSAHSYHPYLMGGMLVAVGGRAKDLLFGATPSRSKLKKTRGFAIRKTCSARI